MRHLDCALLVVLPAGLAAIVQLPAATPVTEQPRNVQVLIMVEVKVTTRPKLI